MFTFELRRNVSDADFLLFLGDLVDEKYEIAGLYLSGQRDQRSSGVYDDRGSVLTERRQGNRRVAGVHNNRGSVLMESARRLAPSADQHGHMQRLALACASTPCLRRRRRGLRSRLVANCGILLGCFDTDALAIGSNITWCAGGCHEGLWLGCLFIPCVVFMGTSGEAFYQALSSSAGRNCCSPQILPQARDRG